MIYFIILLFTDYNSAAGKDPGGAFLTRTSQGMVDDFVLVYVI